MKRLPLALGLLVGSALVFVGGAEPPLVGAAPLNCQKEGNCTFKKPRLAFVLDDSTAMNQAFDADSSRWEAAIEMVGTIIDFDNGYIAENYILGLVRFGHDPNPNVPGSKIVGDTSGLVDGVKLDVPWYDVDDPMKAYLECTNGDAVLAALAALPAPLGGADTGIGAWTHGALTFTKNYIAQADADHPNDMGKRWALLMVLTTGAWTNATNTLNNAPPSQDPTLVAQDMWNNLEIPTYVVAFGGPGDKVTADALASAGGTSQAIDAADPSADLLLVDALKAIVIKIQSTLIAPICTPGIPRVMILLDASSSMLNDGDKRAAPGVGTWDLVRDRLAGDQSIFDILFPNNLPVEDLVHFGLTVFGSASEEKLVVQYGPCHQDHIAWALDPASACVAPGCTDPYGKPKITWTFQDGSLLDPPGLDAPTINHMPDCDSIGPNKSACSGSGNALHLGLQLVASNFATHKAECMMDGAQIPCHESTQFLNVLITDGAYDSTDAQVQAPLLAMHDAGVVTHVIGYGDAVDLPQLAKLADWGSAGTVPPTLADTQDELEAAFQGLLKLPVFDECCSFQSCDFDGNDTFETNEDTGETNNSGTTDGTGDTGDTGTTSTTGDASTTAPVDSTTGDTGTTAPIDTTGSPGSTSTTGGDGSSTVGFEASGVDGTAAPTDTAPTGDGPPTSDGTAADDTSGTDTAPSESATDKGCGCSSDDPAPGASLLLLGLLGLRRRRARA